MIIYKCHTMLIKEQTCTERPSKLTRYKIQDILLSFRAYNYTHITISNLTTCTVCIGSMWSSGSGIGLRGFGSYCWPYVVPHSILLLPTSSEGYLVDESCVLVAQTACILVWRMHCILPVEIRLLNWCECCDWEGRPYGQLNMVYAHRPML